MTAPEIDQPDVDDLRLFDPILCVSFKPIASNAHMVNDGERETGVRIYKDKDLLGSCGERK